MVSRSEARPSYFDILNKEVAGNYHEASFHTNKVRPIMMMEVIWKRWTNLIVHQITESLTEHGALSLS